MLGRKKELQIEKMLCTLRNVLLTFCNWKFKGLFPTISGSFKARWAEEFALKFPVIFTGESHERKVRKRV